ncbi:hypothetical protein RZE84_05470 [Mollicutes bacterium LVI A0075]|nr:hypothetical protein RZE84_05470 [Mollicutes bacterium LVI A0075]
MQRINDRFFAMLKTVSTLLLVYIILIYNLLRVEDKEYSKILLIILLLLICVSITQIFFSKKIYFEKTATQSLSKIKLVDRYEIFSSFEIWFLILTPILVFNDPTNMSVSLALVFSLIVVYIISKENKFIYNIGFLVKFSYYKVEIDDEEYIVLTKLHRNDLTSEGRLIGFQLKEGHNVLLVESD